MINPILTPLHVTELDELQAHALDVVGQDLDRVLVDPDGYVTDDTLAVDLRFLGIVAAM
ncbi:hypothetical protein [Rhodococcus koreensis]|uniref:hypothetical protein n=1 Tax=Rhodococcus koreensis TaxID=99653 RepID=UPI00366E103B